MMVIFSDKNEIGVVQNLCGDDAQAFTDVIDEVPGHAPSSWKDWPTDSKPNFPLSRVAVGYPVTVALEEVSEHFT